MEIGPVGEDYLVFKVDESEVHIVPNFVTEKPVKHTLTLKCWCCPQLDHVDDETNSHCYLHSAVQ